MFLLENFPNELLEMIFGHFMPSFEVFTDLLPLSEVSPRFNNLIAKSPRLMHGNVVIWRNKKKDVLKIPAKYRKYSDLRLSFIEECSVQLEKFTEKFADSITRIVY